MTSEAVRRRPGQLREDVLRAAGALFVKRGFDGTSMRDIATEAGTTHTMLYRYYPSKVAVFEDAVAAPFQEFMRSFLEHWKSRPVADLPNRELFASFNAGLYDLTVQHRELFLALLSAHTFSRESVGDLAGRLVTGVPEAIAHLQSEQSARGWHGIDLEVNARAAIAMVLGTVLLADWLFGTDPAGLDRDRILREITEMQIAGAERGKR